MLVMISLISSILLGIGFFFLGFLIINFLGLKKTLQNISEPGYQYSLFGIAGFLFFLYPLFFLGLIKSYFLFNINFFFIIGFLLFSKFLLNSY